MTRKENRTGRRALSLTAPAFATLAFALLAFPSSPLQAQEDEYDGLPPGPGREEVHAYCGACHSLRLVQQQGLSREHWAETLDWMIEEQGMPELEEGELKLILDYLATHYNEDRPNYPNN